MHKVTVNPGVIDIVLPNGHRYQANDVVFLQDEEYALIPAAYLGTLMTDNGNAAAGFGAGGFGE